MITYSEMKELNHHLENGVVKGAEQLDATAAQLLASLGLIKKVGAVNMWSVSPEGGRLALDNRCLYRSWPVLSGLLFFLSSSAKNRLFVSMVRH